MNLEDKLSAGKGDALYSEVLIKGKNVSVREILRLLAHGGGGSEKEILQKFPELTKGDILTSYEYAFELIGAIEFKKAMSLIEKVVIKRNAMVEKIRLLKGTNLFGKY
ncbi:DUF433 domain-containing protein [Flavobacterium sp.]|uniref:DUF433 domain-containing protein n=1 Tax=Flavobacterium sp. TaxID=239 RepID=UPI003752C83A